MPIFRGRRGQAFVGGRWKNISDLYLPFGVMTVNGMNFSRSIFDPKSVLRRFLWVVFMSNRDLTKVEILQYAGYRLDTVVPRGYMSGYFAAIRKAGFLTPVRRGRSTVWVKGTNFPASLYEMF